MKKRGYATAIYGKWHVGYDPKYNPENQGFDDFKGFVSGNIDLFSHIDQAGKADWWVHSKIEEEKGYAPHIITKHALKFMRENKDKPFCLYLPQPAPHYPYQGPNDKGYRTIGNSEPGRGIVQDKARAYRDMVEDLDTQVGHIIKETEKLGISENTLIVFCSDNGGTGEYLSSNKPFRGIKSGLYEGGHRVPGIFYWPGKIQGNQVSDNLVTTIDFMPTFVKMADETYDGENLDGIDLRPMLFNGAVIKNRKMFWEFRKVLAMRDGDWKILIQKNGEVELYDLSNDISERKNLVKEKPQKAEQMSKELRAWYKEVTAGVKKRS